ncbi:MAG: hypothetical protein C0596_09945 [Marinilabiliales bacterium]|nr:MAG: hypothetical protein C0596_09945 [Marinilabiliales bacterium]
MKNLNKIFFLILLIIPHVGYCQNEAYSFFLAGHVYGEPGVENEGVHPPFKAKYEYIQGREEIEFGVFLGDMVIWGSNAKWDNIDADIEELGIPVYKVVGNHDMINGEIYFERYGDITYYSFIVKNDLFIVLDPNIDSWNISGDKLVFLQNTISENADECDNIFVMLHELIWWEPDNIYSDIVLNPQYPMDYRDEEINFWPVIEPLFNNLENNVIMCAGDVGAASYASPFMFDQYDNITLLATGMGKGETDNFVVVNVDEDKNIDYELICLNNEELYCFGEFTDYIISTNNTSNADGNISVYPNPVYDKLYFESDTDLTYRVNVYSNTGELIIDKTIENQTNVELDVSGLSLGVYFVRLITENQTINRKIIKI